MPCAVSGMMTFFGVVAARVVVGLREEQAGELAVGSGRRLQGRLVQAGDLGEEPAQLVEELQRALHELIGFVGVQPAQALERRHAFVDLGVVLHRAGAQGIGALVDPVVAPRELGEVAHELDLRHFGQAGRGLPAQGRRGRARRAAAPARRAPAASRPACRSTTSRRSCQPRGTSSVSADAPAADGRDASTRPSSATNASICARVRRSVTATSSTRSSSGHQRPSETPARKPAGASARDDLGGRQRQRHGELTPDGSRRERLDAGQLEQPAAQVVGLARAELAQLRQPGLAEPREVDEGPERVERLVGADVRGGALAADVLLARLQREHEAAPAFDVDGLAHDAPRHAPHQLLARAHEAQVRAPEVEVVAHRLTLADGDVGAVLARRREHAERERIDDGDEEGAGVVGDLRGGRHVLEAAEEVGLLERDGGGLLVDGRAQRGRVGQTAAVAPDLHDLETEPARLGDEHLPVLGMQRPRDDDLRAPRLGVRHEGRLGQRRRPVVERCVAHLERGELADGRLVLEDRLQHALAAFRLIGRVGGVELGAAGDRVDDGRHVVVVGAGAEERDRPRRRRVLAGRAPRARPRAPPRREREAGRGRRAGGPPRGCRRRARRSTRRRPRRASPAGPHRSAERSPSLASSSS